MGDENLTKLLKWSIENQANSDGANPPRQLDPALLKSLFGGPSEADLMKSNMECITSNDPEVTLEAKLTAFDNFEQLIESIDNANNIAKLSLWTPLLGCLEHEESEMRRMAAWCIGTAVQNNVQCQERLLAVGGIPTLVKMALDDGEEKAVRKKALYALSSACRNYQPAMDLCVEELNKNGRQHGKLDAKDMNAVDAVFSPLREAAS
ncbi:hypothetical protein VUR80DRAFT_6635 [Thermomyces stellatus]